MFKFVIIGFLLVAVAHSVPVPVPQDYDYSINHNGDVKPAGFRPHASSNPSSPYGPGEPRQYQDYSEEGSDTAPDYYGNDYGAGGGANYDYYGSVTGPSGVPRGQGLGPSPDYRNGPPPPPGAAGGGSNNFASGDEYANFDDSEDYPAFGGFEK